MEKFEEEIRRAADVVRKGGIILYPTDTVWGIGCDASDDRAVRRVFDIKQRADSKALIVLLGKRDDIWKYVDDVPEVAEQLLDSAVTPITVIYDHGVNLAPSVMAADGSVAVRVSSEKFSSRLCLSARRPLVSTSANVSGTPSPRFFSEIDPQIVEAVDYVVDYRRHDLNPASPSTIIKISGDSTFKIIRR